MMAQICNFRWRQKHQFGISAKLSPKHTYCWVAGEGVGERTKSLDRGGKYDGKELVKTKKIT
jgi:hypothetical protein